jgi:hypothetical protein
LKTFKIIGPRIETEFEIDDDEMIEYHIIKIKDYEKRLEEEKTHDIKD